MLKALLIWMLIAAAEVLHGIHRVRTRQIAVFTGSVIILLIAWFSVPWVGASSSGQQLGVGFLWLVLMLAFEVAIGRFDFGASWQRIAADFDFRRTGQLSIGMAVLLVAPLLVANLRGLI